MQYVLTQKPVILTGKTVIMSIINLLVYLTCYMTGEVDARGPRADTPLGVGPKCRWPDGAGSN